ncbi:hypothetical protein SPHINGOAX6_40223 [Sphingomonas sp. AX6]|nr:hypothetical protein SPHINGOAX6_40223 [Sphingomonas sp. AX6]
MGRYSRRGGADRAFSRARFVDRSDGGGTRRARTVGRAVEKGSLTGVRGEAVDRGGWCIRATLTPPFVSSEVEKP